MSYKFDKYDQEYLEKSNNFLINNYKFKSIMNFLKNQNWESLDWDKKGKLLEIIDQYFSKELNLAPAKIFLGGMTNTFSLQEKAILFSDTALDENFFDVMYIYLHEKRHHYQKLVLDGNIKDHIVKTQTWFKNFFTCDYSHMHNYSYSEGNDLMDSIKYKLQPVEYDADSIALYSLERLYFDLKEKNHPLLDDIQPTYEKRKRYYRTFNQNFYSMEIYDAIKEEMNKRFIYNKKFAEDINSLPTLFKKFPIEKLDNKKLYSFFNEALFYKLDDQSKDGIINEFLRRENIKGKATIIGEKISFNNEISLDLPEFFTKTISFKNKDKDKNKISKIVYNKKKEIFFHSRNTYGYNDKDPKWGVKEDYQTNNDELYNKLISMTKKVREDIKKTQKNNSR